MHTTPQHTNTYLLTPEQEAILASLGNIKINAVAGSGKTTTLIRYAATRPKGSRILYLAFNKAVRLEAQNRFAAEGLPGVQAETAHSLAYKHQVLHSKYNVRPQGYSSYELAGLLGLADHGEKHGAYILANHVGRFMAYFCNSRAAKVQELNYLDTVNDPKAKAFVRTFYSYIETGTRQLLKQMYDGTIGITHDFYLKLFQLAQPVLPYDYILFDEGQDASPAMLDVFLKQKATKVIVGDAHQQIYSWRYAVNSLAEAGFPLYHLTTSFRFPQPIASLATAVLGWKEWLQHPEPVAIKGKGTTPASPQSRALLARTNLGLLLQAITYIKTNKKVQRLYFEGNINSYTYADEGASLYDVLHLYNGARHLIRDPLIATLHNLEDLEEYAEKTEEVQLGMMLEIVQEYGNDIPILIRELKEKHTSEKEAAEIIFSTVHRCKGMEYDSVQLADDFITETVLERLSEEEVKNNSTKLNEEVNLLYVAITRSRGHLQLPEGLLPKGFTAEAPVQVIKKEPTPAAAKEKGDRKNYLEERRKRKGSNSNWSEEGDDLLRKLFHQGLPLERMASVLGRDKKAVLARLRKLGTLGDA